MTSQAHLDTVKPMAGFKSKSIGFATLVLAIGLLTMLVPQAYAQFTFGPLVLRTTYLQGQPNNRTATCSVLNCTAPPQRIFPLLTAICPKPSGDSCTLYIHLESQDRRLTLNDTGLFRFWVDGAPASPGPVDANGFFIWDNNDPDSGTAVPFSHSYAVVAHVLNDEANQPHAVEVDVSCTDADASGDCTARTGFSTLEVNIF